MRLTVNPANTGIVPPYLLDRLEASKSKGGAAKNGLPADGGECFPKVPAQKDPSGIDIVFTDVKLPKSSRAPVNLQGFGPACFPHLPAKADPSGLQILVTGVVLPN